MGETMVLLSIGCEPGSNVCEGCGWTWIGAKPFGGCPQRHQAKVRCQACLDAEAAYKKLQNSITTCCTICEGTGHVIVGQDYFGEAVVEECPDCALGVLQHRVAELNAQLQVVEVLREGVCGCGHMKIGPVKRGDLDWISAWGRFVYDDEASYWLYSGYCPKCGDFLDEQGFAHGSNPDVYKELN